MSARKTQGATVGCGDPPPCAGSSSSNSKWTRPGSGASCRLMSRMCAHTGSSCMSATNAEDGVASSRLTRSLGASSGIRSGSARSDSNLPPGKKCRLSFDRPVPRQSALRTGPFSPHRLSTHNSSKRPSSCSRWCPKDALLCRAVSAAEKQRSTNQIGGE